jgi:isopentenyldiphosphate isomerase
MDEYINIWSEEGFPTKEIRLKDEAHIEGLFHPTVHVWMYTKKSEILLQQRASHKETFPSYWDVSVAGHVMAGEQIEDAALREVKEEIGIDILVSELQQVDVRKNVNKHPNGIIDCEFQHVFLCELKHPVENLVIQEEEVDGITLISLEKLAYEVNHLDTEFQVVPADYSYYFFIIEQVNKLISL